MIRKKGRHQNWLIVLAEAPECSTVFSFCHLAMAIGIVTLARQAGRGIKRSYLRGPRR